MNATDKQLKNNIDEFKGDEAKLDPLGIGRGAAAARNTGNHGINLAQRPLPRRVGKHVSLDNLERSARSQALRISRAHDCQHLMVLLQQFSEHRPTDVTRCSRQ